MIRRDRYPSGQTAVRMLVGQDSLADLWPRHARGEAASYFVSSGWVDSWARTILAETPLHLVEILDADSPFAAGLLSERPGGNALGMPQRVLHLHRTGRPEKDCITVEYNGLLAPAARSQEALERLVEGFAAGGDFRAWPCLDLPGLTESDADAARAKAETARLRVQVQEDKPVFGVRLDALPREAAFLETLGKNTRHQIRRSLRLLETNGPVQLEDATDTAQAEAFFDRLKILHQADWTARGQPGAFAEPFFERFHRRLVADRFDSGEISLLRISAGETEIGYLYNFNFGTRVYAYQSGFAQFADPKIKPGFVSHVLAIERARTHGYALYDFMAGEAGHKDRLGELTGRMLWLRLSRRRPAQEAEYWARKLKQRLAAGRGGG